MNNEQQNDIEIPLRATGPSESATALGRALSGKQGKQFWRSFDELAETEEFQQWVEDEFPNRRSLFEIDRRQFLRIGGAALALAGVSGCRYLPQRHAVPYVRAPEEMVSGKPLIYASTVVRGGYGLGVLVESNEGRPTKIEGNPRHPASLGATDAYAQAEILSLYDPDRSQVLTNQGEVSGWDEMITAIHEPMRKFAQNGGAGLRILTETVTSPTLAAQLNALTKKFPQAQWHQYEPLARDNVHAGAQMAFGKIVNTVYHFDKANVVLSLDSDFLLGIPGSVRYARDFTNGRRVRNPEKATGTPKMNRLYVVESAYTITGAMADHRVPVKPSQVDAIARAVLSGVSGESVANAPQGMPTKVLTELVKELRDNQGMSLVVAGDEQPAAVHALAHAINSALGNTGKTVTYTAPVEARAEVQSASLRRLTEDLNTGKVSMLVILGGNPVYTAPVDLNFPAAVEKASIRIRLGLYQDETSAYCQWHVPEAHFLESWGDARAYDGTASIVQPLIQPLYQGKSASEMLAEILDEPRPGYEIVRDYWAGQYKGTAFDAWWQTALHDGIVPNTASPAETVTVQQNLVSNLPVPTSVNGIEISFRPDPSLWDGRYANNSWLQELPKPITTLTWDNAAIISPAMAKNLKLVPNTDDGTDANNVARNTSKQMVNLKYNNRTLKMPVWVLPGQPDDVITVHLGFGRTAAGNVGNGQGFDTYTLRTSDAPGFGGGVAVTSANDTYDLVYTQTHHQMRGGWELENRDIVRTATFADYVAHKGEVEAPGHKIGEPEDKITGPDGGPRGEEDTTADYYRQTWSYTRDSKVNKDHLPSLYPNYSYKDFNAWGMAIDLTTCTGCNACVIACQAENNIPTVGKDQVGKGREMHWIRIDHYFGGDDLANPESVFQPLMCVHCEKAPCEPVCPVAATVHSHEGLNQMVYNRCVGTRYCSNNCPYKVRRFNFLKWTAGIGGPTTVNYELPVLKMVANPDVTIRGRGVMEKCTYCIQRINAVRIESKKAYREIQDGEIVTACQQVCPTNAIVFGDINDPNSRVSKLKNEPHDYELLAELNTRPRTSYMARLKNPNPALLSTSADAKEKA